MKGAGYMRSRRHLAFAIAVIFLVAVLSGCADETTTESEEEQVTATYADLSESEQEIIDLIYNNKSSWMHISNGGYDYFCVYVGFTSYGDNNECVFIARNKSSTESSNGWKAWYSFDTETGEFECLDLNFVSGLDVFGSWTEDYRDWDEEELKDALAAKYISYWDSLEEDE